MEPAREPEAALGARAAHLRVAAGPLAFAAVAALAFADGGFDPTTWGWGALGLAWAAAAALLLGRAAALSRLELAQLGALAAFAAWTPASAAWSESIGLTLEEARRPLVYLAALGALALWARRPVHGLLAGIAAAGTLVAAWNLASRLWPDRLGESIHGFPGDFGAPVGYENGVGLLAALTVLLGGGLAVSAQPWLRLAALPSVAVAAAALAASGSRGAWVALACGAAAGAALRLPRPRLAFATALVLGAATIGGGALAASEQRQAYWGATTDLVAADPLLGSGAGTWERGWLREREEPFAAQDAHSLYLETLAELGPIGLALLVAALVPPLVAAVRARRRPLVPAAAAAYVGFLLHAGVDWDWELPAVTIAGLACGVAILAAAREEVVAVGRTGYVALAVVAALAAYGLAGSWAHASAAGALLRADWQRAEDRARLAARLEPWSSRAWRLRGEAEAAAGDEESARASFREAVREDAGDVESWRALTRVTEGAERRSALERARRLDPLGAPAPGTDVP